MRTLMLAGALALASAAASADEPRWLLSLEGGGSRIHDDDSSGALALRLQRGIDSRGVLRVQLGAAVASYGALDAGAEVHPLAGRRVSPFVGVGGGFTAEDEYAGRFFRGTAGVEVKLAPRAVLRLAVQAGTHDGQEGPHLATIGLGWRF